MYYVYLLIEIILVFTLMLLAYKFNKKDGLYIFIGFMAGLLPIVMLKTTDIMNFEINFGLPIIVSVFAVNNVIIQRYGMDEVKRISLTFALSYIIPIFIISLASLFTSNFTDINIFYDELYRFNINYLRAIIGALISILFMLWCSSNIYFDIRKNKYNFIFSNISSLLIVQFLESVIFILISYSGLFDITILFGMIVIRYLLKVLIGLLSLIPIYMLIKTKEK